MCSGLRKIIEDASSLSHRLNILELHSFITMNDTEMGVVYCLSILSIIEIYSYSLIILVCLKNLLTF